MQEKENGPTEQFIKMTQEERQTYVQSIPLSEKQLPLYSEGHQYPQQDFMDFQGNEYGQTIKLKTYRYPAKTQAKGVFIILHSYYVHSQYTAHIAKRLSDQGFTSVAFDMRGAGKSEGERSQWNDYKAIIQETYNFIKAIQKMYPDSPLFVLGWGIAGLNVLYISLYYYKEFNFAGIVMASTLFKCPASGQTFKVVGSVSQGEINISPGRIGIYKPDYTFFTRHKKIKEILEKDPLNAHEMTNANSLMEYNDLLLDIPDRLWCKMSTPPIVVLHGMADKYGSGYFAYDFYKQIQSPDKQLWYYKDMNFSFMLQDQYPEIEERLVKWAHSKTKKFNEEKQKKKEEQASESDQ